MNIGETAPVGTVKDHIRGYSSFTYFRENALWYTTNDTGFMFPVPVNDIGSAQFLATEKSMLMMRYIRKYIEENYTQAS